MLVQNKSCRAAERKYTHQFINWQRRWWLFWKRFWAY